MRLTKIATNAEVVGFANVQVLFSRGAPVAYRYLDGKYYVTADRCDKQTTATIRLFLNGHVADVKPQEFFDGLKSLLELAHE